MSANERKQVVHPGKLDVDRLAAIDVHVHLHPTEASAVDEAAEKYFGKSGAAPGGDALAEYYRSRNMACIVFAVDEHLTGRRQVTNDEVIEFASKHADVAMAFASVDPNRGAEG